MITSFETGCWLRMDGTFPVSCKVKQLTFVKAFGGVFPFPLGEAAATILCLAFETQDCHCVGWGGAATDLLRLDL